MAYFFDLDDGQHPDSAQGTPAREFSSSSRQLESFKERLHQEILRSQRRNYSLTLMRLEVTQADPRPDGFVEAIKSAIREYDLLCHLRPAEFIIVFPETEERGAEQIAKRIRQTVEERSWADAVDDACGANIGIACYPQDGTTAEDLMDSAEQELHISRKLNR